MSKRTTLVTGASAGIGAAIAREYASRGWDLVLTARREDPMRALADDLRAAHNTACEILPADLAEASAPKELMDEIGARGIVLDGLVNNAGYGHPGTYLDSPWEDHARCIQLMATAPSELAHRAATGMVERGFGHIINVASLAGHMPGSKGHTLYAAVKAYLVKFSESLNLELKSAGVHVSALCPGFTWSEFHDVNGTREQLNTLPDFMMMTAEDVAEQAVDAVERNKAVHVTGRVNKTLAVLGKLLPPSVSSNLMEKNSAKFRNTDG